MSADATSRSNPVRVVSATLASLQALLAVSLVGDVVGLKVAGLLSAMVAAAQFGLGEYVRSQVTPWADVVAKRAQDGTAVAGPAAQVPTGAEVLEPEAVEVALPPDPVVADPVDTGAAAAAGDELETDPALDPPAIAAPPGADGIAIQVPAKKAARRRRT